MMKPPYAGHYTPVKATANAYCHGCGLTLIRKTHWCWADDRAPGALVCGRCVMADPQMYAETPGHLTAAAPHDGEVPGQATIEEHL